MNSKEKIRLCEELHTKNNEARDKALLTLSAAALGFSLTFIDKINLHTCLSLIYLSWICFAGSMLCVLYSFQTAAVLTNQLAEYNSNKKKHSKNIKFINSIYKWRGLTVWLHRISITFFTIGAVAFMIFSMIAVQQKQDSMKDYTSTLPAKPASQGVVQKGFVPTSSSLPVKPPSPPTTKK